MAPSHSASPQKTCSTWLTLFCNLLDNYDEEGHSVTRKGNATVLAWNLEEGRDSVNVYKIQQVAFLLEPAGTLDNSEDGNIP